MHKGWQRDEKTGGEREQAFNIMTDGYKNPTEWWFVLHFPLDEICTTADCTQSGRYCVSSPYSVIHLLYRCEGSDFLEKGRMANLRQLQKLRGSRQRENGHFLIIRNMPQKVIVLSSSPNKSTREAEKLATRISKYIQYSLSKYVSKAEVIQHIQAFGLLLEFQCSCQWTCNGYRPVP